MKSFVMLFFFTALVGTNAKGANDNFVPKYVNDQLAELESYLQSTNNNLNLDLAEGLVHMRKASPHPMVQTATLHLCAALVKRGRAHELAKNTALAAKDKFEDVSVKLAVLTVLMALNSVPTQAMLEKVAHSTHVLGQIEELNYLKDQVENGKEWEIAGQVVALRINSTRPDVKSKALLLLAALVQQGEYIRLAQKELCRIHEGEDSIIQEAAKELEYQITRVVCARYEASV